MWRGGWDGEWMGKEDREMKNTKKGGEEGEKVRVRGGHISPGWFKARCDPRFLLFLWMPPPKQKWAPTAHNF